MFKWVRLRDFITLENINKCEYSLMLLLPLGRYGIVLMKEKDREDD